MTMMKILKEEKVYLAPQVASGILVDLEIDRAGPAILESKCMTAREVQQEFSGNS